MGERTISLLAKSIDGICLSRDTVFWHEEHKCLDGKNVSGGLRHRGCLPSRSGRPSSHPAHPGPGPRRGGQCARLRVTLLRGQERGQEWSSWPQVSGDGRGREGEIGSGQTGKHSPPGAKAAARCTPALSPNPPTGLPPPGTATPARHRTPVPAQAARVRRRAHCRRRGRHARRTAGGP